MIAANNLKVEGAGFGVDTNVLTLITADETRQLPLMSKDEAARRPAGRHPEGADRPIKPLIGKREKGPFAKAKAFCVLEEICAYLAWFFSQPSAQPAGPRPPGAGTPR